MEDGYNGIGPIPKGSGSGCVRPGISGPPGPVRRAGPGGPLCPGEALCGGPACDPGLHPRTGQLRPAPDGDCLRGMIKDPLLDTAGLIVKREGDTR